MYLMMELALPAGNLENALVAFRSGADAVYFGMKTFSARRGAVNFTEEDLAKIRRVSRENGKKIYVTINTLVDDHDLTKAYDLLSTVEKYSPDGIIVQDLGLIELMKREFPTLPIHGSTQLAAHNISGVKAMQDMGFERVVLSRELTFKEIEKIRTACPDIELKVFIHGAMCYGFSGYCMASKYKTGRSANEGSCAQICRTWFRDVETGKAFYPFSLKDMELGEQIIRLDDIGIDSAKIEGRLKGNEYVAATTRLYRNILDGKRDMKHEQYYTFSRERGTGFLDYNGPGHDILTTGDYTGHIGAKAGYVLQQEGRRVKLDLQEKIEAHDGLMYLKRNKEGLLESVRFAANPIRDDVFILPTFEKLEKNQVIYKVSDSRMTEKKPSTNLPLEKTLVKAEIDVNPDTLTVKTPRLEKKYDIEVQESDKMSAEEQILKVFSQSGESSHQLFDIKVNNNTGFDKYFLRSSSLKEARRDFLSELDSLPDEKREYEIKPFDGNARNFTLPAREMISGEHTPWQTEGRTVDGITYITLPPVIYDDGKFYEELEEKLEKLPRPLLIGLNNIGHIDFAKKHTEYNYFADIYLYLSNRESARLLSEELGRNLYGGYLWMERDEYVEPWPFTPTIVKDFTPPLFISRACYRHDGLGLECKGCTRDNHYVAEQNGILHDIYVKDCNTVVCLKKDKEE